MSEFEGETRFVILTTAANDSMKEVHDRMPVVLPPERLEEWLGDAKAAARILEDSPPALQKTPPEEHGTQLSMDLPGSFL